MPGEGQIPAPLPPDPACLSSRTSPAGRPHWPLVSTWPGSSSLDTCSARAQGKFNLLQMVHCLFVQKCMVRYTAFSTQCGPLAKCSVFTPQCILLHKCCNIVNLFCSKGVPHSISRFFVRRTSINMGLLTQAPCFYPQEHYCPVHLFGWPDGPAAQSYPGAVQPLAPG